MGSGGGHSLHGIRKRVDTCTEINGNISEPCELADTSVLKFGFNKVVSGEVVGDTKRIESIGTNISIKVGGVGEPRKGLRLGSSKAGRSSACTLHVSYRQKILRYVFHLIKFKLNQQSSHRWWQGQKQRQSQQGQRQRQASSWCRTINRRRGSLNVKEATLRKSFASTGTDGQFPANCSDLMMGLL